MISKKVVKAVLLILVGIVLISSVSTSLDRAFAFVLYAYIILSLRYRFAQRIIFVFAAFLILFSVIFIGLEDDLGSLAYYIHRTATWSLYYYIVGNAIVFFDKPK